MALLSSSTLAKPTSSVAAEVRSPLAATVENQRAVRDSLIVTVGGQLERALGTLTALALKWGLDPARHGVYSGLRLFLDHTNRSSLGISVGAVQEIPILRAKGREDEARFLANVAYTTNTLTCFAYALGLLWLAWWWSSSLVGNPLAAEWTWGLVSVAGLAVLKRYQDFLIALHRAHQRFVLTTELAVLDSLVSAVLVVLGLWLAGFWGLLGAVGGLLGFNIVYLHVRHPMRCRWAWQWPTIKRLFRVGLPIMANTAAFSFLLSLDRVLILWLVPNGAYAAGLYTVAVMGTSWSLDLAGRIATVMYTYFQTTLGRTQDPIEVVRQAARVTEAQAPILAAGSAVAYLVGPVFLGLLIPRYAEGLPALRPLLPGMLLLGLAWPARQALITVDRPFRLAAATGLGFALTAMVGSVGAIQTGIVGVAWGMTFGFSGLYFLTSAVAFSSGLGTWGWLAHQGRIALPILWYASGAVLAAHLPLGLPYWPAFGIRCAFLAAWCLPTLWHWGRKNGWGGLLGRWRKESKSI